ncbi:NAD-dependent epimerase/dehydratase family protein [Hyunsoonleella flava]|uniref:NAD-dependent epimerase/dehydratase family protein n=1 Tax=Hyunsoonleella flava TaxID=2527939 RepID=A0A4Q9FGC6_9FLAO|nr:NAD-dependent epimerase/dehydratase family protein [Hyunsoonleella flava]TBM99002.1 NAD-dependent epimerase/dehydratase family protein [Hyunsoonleella flava]
MILVTGGTGLVGAHLLYKLVSDNEAVRAIYRTERKLQNVKNVFSCYGETDSALFDKIEWVKADILDIPSLNEALNEIEYVYHCAAFVSFEPDKYQFLRQINIEGTANVVNVCIAKGVKKMCYVSSIATVGNPVKEDEVITEETHWNPEDDNSVYAITKYGAEMEVWRGTQEGLDAVIVNPGVILGAGIWRYGSGNLFKKIHDGINYYTSGNIGLVSVTDVVNIMIKLLKSDIKNERYILVAENWSYKSFLQTMARALHVKLPKKLAKPWILKIGWRLDWLKRQITGKRRKLTKQLTKSLTTKTNYSNKKITKALNYKFEPVELVISEIADQYLKQVQ